MQKLWILLVFFSIYSMAMQGSDEEVEPMAKTSATVVCGDLWHPDVFARQLAYMSGAEASPGIVPRRPCEWQYDLSVRYPCIRGKLYISKVSLCDDQGAIAHMTWTLSQYESVPGSDARPIEEFVEFELLLQDFSRLLGYSLEYLMMSRESVLQQKRLYLAQYAFLKIKASFDAHALCEVYSKDGRPFSPAAFQARALFLASESLANYQE